MTESDQLDSTFAALTSPIRRAILARLAQGEATVNDLAAPFEMSLPAVSKHIRVLEDAGLITRSRSAQFRPCKLNARPLADIVNWTEQYRPIWEGRFDAMEDAIRARKDKHDE